MLLSFDRPPQLRPKGTQFSRRVTFHLESGADLFSLMRADDVAGAARRRARSGLPAECDAMRRAAAAGDWDEVRRRAHYLRNSALVLGEGALVLAAEMIERAAAQADGSAVNLGVRRLDDLIPALRG